MSTDEGLIRRLSPLFAIDLAASLALLEPALGRLRKLGDALDAKQYLFIMPAGEVAYLVPAAREASVPAMGVAGAVMLLIGLLPAARRLKSKGLDRWSALGWLLVSSGLVMLASEYATKGEWVLFRRIGARYLAFAFVSVGSFLAFRDRRFLATLGMAGFTWDLSSAVFWAWLQRDPRATVPVPWYHHFDEEAGRGAPCWLVALADLSGILYCSWLYGHDFDPLRLFED